MNIKQMYGLKITELLKKYHSKNEPLAETGFFIFENFEENAILFIGINPSNVKNIHKYSIYKEDGIYWGREEFKKEHNFYQHFDELSCGMKWSHLDLYFTLETKQEKLEKMLGNTFLLEQYNISEEIIHIIQPKIIVVGNAYASRLIRNGYCCEFDKDIGTYRIKNFNNIPIFFSGIFTGSRALDVGSRERLIWHIGFVKEKYMVERSSDNT